MLITEPLPFIRDFIDQLNNVIKAHFPDKQLSRTQRYWLAFAVMSIILLTRQLKVEIRPRIVFWDV